MRSPPYFARIRRSSSRQPSAKPMASATLEHPSAQSQVGREGIIELSWNRGGAPGLAGSDTRFGGGRVSVAGAAGAAAGGVGAAAGAALAAVGLRAAALAAFFAAASSVS